MSAGLSGKENPRPDSPGLTPYNQFVPPGHYYSPIPDLDEVRGREEAIFGHIPRQIPGIDLNEQEQLSLLGEFKNYYSELPFKPEKSNGLRYFFENPSYSYSDAVFLYSMIRHAKPKKIIEIGSGYSSCVMLDTNERFFDGSIKITCIEPFPELLLSLIRPGDLKSLTLISKRLQDVQLSEFESLSQGDILFIDSTHVSKVNSDVNRIFFEILPRLKRGVYVHFHDIFYPFEYPKEWIYEGRAWTELYVLRSFLQFNASFKIVFFNTFLEHFHQPTFEQEMPLCMRNRGGSIWIRRV
ncbi:MAG: class I SAM-dependent methyltransferase [Deltaproteobacteria bacterium]|nr:class I SAM-dependent methyltransferase [Deltaproteobacteria bacterium]